ncbi:MAG: diaminopimelate epimerase [Pseudomonadales bacterium]
MSLEFAKMHGLGNDFMVVDLVSQSATVDEARIRAWSDRHTGVGFDQLLLIEPPSDPDADFRYRIFNADGGEVEQCGNGARCAARYVAHRQLSPKTTLILQTQCGPIVTRLLDAGMVEVDMGEPRTGPGAIPFDPQADGSARPCDDGAASRYELQIAAGTWQFTPVSIGNPHAVLFVDSIANAPVATVGAALVGHAVFPEGANIGFCEVVDRGFLRLRVFERGVGETRACGTGACAAVVAAHLQGKVGDRVKVSLPGGKVRISWQGPGSTLKMTGPTALVFEGKIEL